MSDVISLYLQNFEYKLYIYYYSYISFIYYFYKISKSSGGPIEAQTPKSRDL